MLAVASIVRLLAVKLVNAYSLLASKLPTTAFSYCVVCSLHALCSLQRDKVQPTNLQSTVPKGIPVHICVV